jgi:hypothetical protein
MLSDLVKVVAGALIALAVKEAFDRWHSKVKERQTRWLPLLQAAQDLRTKLLDLVQRYRTPQSQWDDHLWKDSRGMSHPLPSEARDFHELYLLDFDAEPIEDFNRQPINPGERRHDAASVRRVKARVHELNRATVSMHKMAAYLGYAQRMRRELRQGQLLVSLATQREIAGLLDDVRAQLNGSSGAGFIDDLQDLLGESVWENEGVIGYYAFRERILSVAGWEQFNELFRFFVHFHYKADHEVQDTVEALGILCVALEHMVRLRWRWHSGLRNALAIPVRCMSGWRRSPAPVRSHQVE